MRTLSAFGTAILGSAVISITYGLARFDFGVFLPDIRASMGFGATSAGIIGALPFVTFIGGILTGPALCRRLGVRWSGGLAMGLAAAGLTIIALAPGSAMLGLGVAVCGISTGLSSPVMAEAVHRVVAPPLQGRVNAVHNAATSFGIALALPAMAVFSNDWRSAYTVFALLAVFVAFAVLACLPGRPKPDRHDHAGERPANVSRGQWQAIARLSMLAGITGLVSSIYWVFAPDLVVSQGGLPSGGHAGWMWLAVGGFGLVGGTARDLIAHLGARMTHGLALFMLAGSLALTALAPGTPVLVLGAAGIFGAAYMVLTGFYLVQGISIMDQRPALGPVMPFLATTIGQALGSSLSGWAIDSSSYMIAFLGFAGLGSCVALILSGLADRQPCA